MTATDFRRLAGSGLAGILAAFLFLHTFSSGVVAAEAEAPPEVGWVSDDPADSPSLPRVPWEDFDTELELAVAGTVLLNDDLDRTYGHLTTFGLGVTFALGAETRMFLTADYGRRSGDPYYDVAGFDQARANRLQTVPMSWGIRSNFAPLSRIKVLYGAALVVTYVREKAPVLSGTQAAGVITSSGLLTGFKITLGPEWRTRDRSRAVGLEFSYAVSKGHVKSSDLRRRVDLTGFTARLYYAFML